MQEEAEEDIITLMAAAQVDLVVVVLVEVILLQVLELLELMQQVVEVEEVLIHQAATVVQE
jgi:hypothetical protein